MSDDTDDLDEMIWEHNHSVTSTHWAWRAWRKWQVHRQSRWNRWLFIIAMRFDPPKGQPTPGVEVLRP